MIFDGILVLTDTTQNLHINFLFLQLDFWSGKEEKESKANELMNWGIIILQWDCAS